MTGISKLKLMFQIWPSPLFINKVLLEHNYTIHLCIVYGYSQGTEAGLFMGILQACMYSSMAAVCLLPTYYY